MNGHILADAVTCYSKMDTDLGYLVCELKLNNEESAIHHMQNCSM